MTGSIIINICWIIGGLALILYPGILIANVMSLAAPRDKSLTWRDSKYWLRVIPFRLMMIVTTLHPVIYFVCIKFSKAALNHGEFMSALFWTLPGVAFSALLYFFLRPPRKKKTAL